MALPEHLVDVRKYAFRAQRSLDKLYDGDPKPSFALYEARDSLRACVRWLNEYTEEVDSREEETEPSAADLA